jgi:hypothetical protein
MKAIMPPYRRPARYYSRTGSHLPTPVLTQLRIYTVSDNNVNPAREIHTHHPTQISLNIVEATVRHAKRDYLAVITESPRSAPRASKRSLNVMLSILVPSLPPYRGPGLKWCFAQFFVPKTADRSLGEFLVTQNRTTNSDTKLKQILDDIELLVEVELEKLSFSR